MGLRAGLLVWRGAVQAARRCTRLFAPPATCVSARPRHLHACAASPFSSLGHGGPHDVGGLPELLKSEIFKEEPATAFWERQAHSLLGVLSAKGLITVDELRRVVESLHPDQYARLSYYEKWLSAMATMLHEQNILTTQELEAALGPRQAPEAPAFSVGDPVRVHAEELITRWRKPHLRTPGYLFGCVGEVVEYCGAFDDPEIHAFCREAPKMPVYKVRFHQHHVWRDYEGPASDTVEVQVFQSWLQGTSEADLAAAQHEAQSAAAAAGASNGTDSHVNHSHSHGHDRSRDHSHGHDEEHNHGTRAEIEAAAVDKEPQPCQGELFAQGLLQALYKKGIVTPAEVQEAVEQLDTMGYNMEGPRIVARSWVDNDFRDLLSKDAVAAAAQLGIQTSNPTSTTLLTAVINTEHVHNVVVCTLCSCYPVSILGLSPPWYKSRSYRARVVRTPRVVLKEFGFDVPNDVEVRVHDSTADHRYIVIPARPAGTEGWSEEELAPLVTRDSMIGVSPAISPLH
eukprot:m.7020 g.7020  ORF g.7020 m.7020 type:complete len:513 (+) comp2790_c0_seq1:54-1592(+)